MLYFSLRAILRFFFSIFYRYRVSGVEHIPKTGSAIICANHISNFDPPLVGCASPRIVHFMAKKEVFNIPILHRLLKGLHAFPVNRQGGGRQALKISMELLKQGKILGIFPEGTRSKTGQLGKGHMGAASLASKLEVPIIPAAIIGPYRLFRPIHIVFGKPIDPNTYQLEKDRSKAVKDLMDDVMKEIGLLLESNQVDHYK